VFPEKVISFGTRLFSALSDHCILTFSYCIRPPPPVDWFVSYKNGCKFFELPGGTLGLGALCDTPDVDLQDSLLTDFVNHLYGFQ
jgi:hypothetical protein